MLWIVWLVFAVLALAGELFTLGLYLASFAVAALLTAAIAVAFPVQVQLGVFVLASVVCLFAVRPAVLPLLPTGGSAVSSPRIGPATKYALASGPIDRRGGQIRVGAGEFYSARSADPSLAIAANEEVEIVGMDGLVAVVQPVRRAEPDRPVPAVRESAGGDSASAGLSARELEVLGLMALGMSNAEIAARLVVSQRTVDHHVSHILNKMGASSRVDAVRLGIARGLVTPVEPEG